MTTVAAARGQLDRVAERLSRSAVSDPSPTDRVDISHISHEMVGLLTARSTMKTAVQLARTAEEVQRHAINLLA